MTADELRKRLASVTTGIAGMNGRVGRARIRPAEWSVLAGFAALSVWVLAFVATRAAHGRTWTGTDGVGLQDQTQYLAWIRDSARHVLASNLFAVVPSPHDYLHPLVVISALLTTFGSPPWLALLLWKPVAVGCLFFAVRSYVRRLLPSGPGQIAALLIAFFFVGPGQLIARALDHVGRPGFPWHDVTLDPWVGWWTWGYPFGLVGLASALAAILVYERQRERGGGRATAPALGLLASWVHPWQGATLIGVLIASEAAESVRHRTRPRLFALLPTCGATAVPLAYYAILGRADPAWRQAQAASSSSWPLWALVVCELPLLIPALVAYTDEPRSFVERATYLWPFAALVTFGLAVKAGGFALHSFLGINVPLAGLAVRGWTKAAHRLPFLRRTAVAAFAISALVVPALAEQLRWARATALSSADAKFVTRSEADALGSLARTRAAGGVLTRAYLGTLVPGETGRAVYVGNSYWSPGFVRRAQAADRLFLGAMSPGAARRFVRSTGARFVLLDCSSRDSLEYALAPLTRSARRFGCAAVLELR